MTESTCQTHVIDDWTEFVLPHEPLDDPEWPAPRSLAEGVALLERLSPSARAIAAVTMLEPVVGWWHRWLDDHAAFAKEWLQGIPDSISVMDSDLYYRPGMIDRSVQALHAHAADRGFTSEMRADIASFNQTYRDNFRGIEAYFRILDSLLFDIDHWEECVALTVLYHAFDALFLLGRPDPPPGTPRLPVWDFTQQSMGRLSSAASVLSHVLQWTPVDEANELLLQWWRRVRCHLAVANITSFELA